MPVEPLRGMRVVDFGQYIAGPAAAMMLADAGAQVVKVHPPGGPRWPGPATEILDRDKTVMTLDLTRAADRRTAAALIAEADVLVENFRPGVMRRMGLDPHDLATAHPRLVSLSLPGFASTDPELSAVPAWEAIIGAATGLFADMGSNRVLMGVQPSFTPLPLASAYGAVLGALAVTLALRARERTGRGDVIEVPLAAALAEGLAHNSIHVPDMPERYKTLREREIERRRAEGLPFDLSYAEVHRLLDPLYKSYRCADGRWLYLVCTGHVRHTRRALELLGIWDEVVASGLPRTDPYRSSREWPDGQDCTLWSPPLSERWAAWLSERIAAAMLARDSLAWERLFGEHGVPATAHRTTAEWLASPHARAARLIVEREHPRYGRLAQPSVVGWVEDGAAGAGPVRPAVRPAQSRAGAAWLEDVRIVDLANVIAGPTIASTLARFGAKVTRVDPPRSPFDPLTTVVFGLQTNRGKRSALLDAKQPEGRRLLRELVGRADVVTINALAAQLGAVGLDPRDLPQGVVLCRLDAWGGPAPGPRSEHPGYDDTVQAATGIMARFGGSLETPEEHAQVGTIDVLSGFAGAYAAALALLERERTGTAPVARSSLALAGQLIQLPFMYDHPGRGPFDEPSGPQANGYGDLHRAYEASDGWLYLACPPRRRAALASIPELAGIEAQGDEEVAEFLTARIALRPRSYWREACAAIDVAAMPIRTMADVRRASLGAPDGATLRFDRESEHPSGRAVELISPVAVRSARAPLAPLAPAPAYGAHTREILAELGCSDAEIEDLLERGIAAARWSDEYLPT
ncbi:MAG TPA: CoA transferase [Capillimicrobium sp.]|nr:CoA transferase [Capillimicrobium sp.]